MDADEARDAEQARLKDEFRQASDIAVAGFGQDVPPLPQIYANALEMEEVARQVDEEAADGLWEEMICLYEELAGRGYRERECRLAIARCWYERANFRQSRLAVEECLEIDPEWEEATKFAEHLRSNVLREGKTVIYGFLAIGALASLFLAWRRSGGR